MRTVSDGYRPGERYLLQCVGGVERIAEAYGAGPGVRLVTVGAETRRPERPLPGGEWLIEHGERVVRDWMGRHWSVGARPANGTRPADLPPGGCWVEFLRREPGGRVMRYRAASVQLPALLDDAALVRLLRTAWNALATDAPERLRRTGEVPAGIEL